MNEPKPDLIITPDTKVARLLEAYPQLEDTLIEIAPPFAKLKNPVLRKTVARVTTLRQAAKVGNVELATVINRLRSEVGQASMTDIAAEEGFEQTAPPEWFDIDKVVEIVDTRQMLEEGDKPLALVMKHLDKMPAGNILELITPFMPAPLIDTARRRGFNAWTEEKLADEYHTFFKLQSTDKELE